MKLLIADDHPVVRHGIKQILADTADLIVEGEAESGGQVLQLVRARHWDALLLDLSMPDGGDGLELLKQVKRESPRLPVLILSVHPEEQFAVRALRAGASGYLTKESAPNELVGALRKIVTGGTYVSPSLAEKLAANLLPDVSQPPHELLSDREYQVLRMMASGKTTGDIAEELSLSVKTVSTYRARLLEKMRLKTNAELISYAIRHRLVE